MKDKY